MDFMDLELEDGGSKLFQYVGGCIVVCVVLYSGRLKVDLYEIGWEVLIGFIA